VKIFGADNKEMIAISAIERDGRELVLRGRIFGTMPMTARAARGSPWRFQTVELAHGPVPAESAVSAGEVRHAG
jgi:hypothetical protein